MFPYQDPSQPVETRVADLLNRMTVEEKVGQCVQSFGGEYKTQKEYLDDVRAGKIGSRIMCGSPWAGTETTSVDKAIRDAEELDLGQHIAVEESRLGIPLIHGRDIIHGHRVNMPIPLAQAAAFRPEYATEGARIAAKEASADYVHWTFSPMMDICRDPRWGRIIEGFGEDPYLASEMAVATVQGFQGDDLSSPEHLAACAKHFAGYGFAEGGRDYDAVEISEYTMRNLVLRPFEAAVKRGKISTLMSSFQVNNGTPDSADHHLLTDILRGEWGFDGFIVSDWGSVEQAECHGAVQDSKDCARRCFHAGTTMEMVNNLYPKYVKELIDEGKISMAELDAACASVLRIKFRRGLFEHPYTDFRARQKDVGTPENRAFARKFAADCMVLAENDGILPLDASKFTGKRIALIGPYVYEKASLLGTWSLNGLAEETPSIAEAFTAAAKKYNFELMLPDSQLSDRQIDSARRRADLIIACVGEHAWSTGEAHSRARVALPPGQEEFLRALQFIGKPLVVVCTSGRPLPVNGAEKANALLYTWHGGSETANALADVLFGDAEPTGRFPVSVPRCTEQIPIYYNRKFPGKTASFMNECKTESNYPFYDDEQWTPRYCFGYGKSYTEFELGSPKLAATVIPHGAENSVSVSVKNTGKRRGTTVVQCYLRDFRASYSRPVKELIGFRKITLNPGESCEVEFPITEAAMGFYAPNGERLLEAGVFKIGVGFNSDLELDQEFRME